MPLLFAMNPDRIIYLKEAPGKWTRGTPKLNPIINELLKVSINLDSVPGQLKV